MHRCKDPLCNLMPLRGVQMLEGDRQGTSLPNRVCWACHHAAQSGYGTANSLLDVSAVGGVSPAG